jgi:hypothetical protein
MQDYITGFLEMNEVTERYHGLPFAALLTIRTMYGKTIEIHDREAIAGDLQLGKSYNFIVAVGEVDKVRAFTQSKTMSGRFSGTIRELRWTPPPGDKLLLVNEARLNEPMSVIGTVSGNVLLSRLLLGGVAVGNAVTWGKDLFELVAVYNPVGA